MLSGVPTRPLGFQRWRSLLFVHWPVPVAALRPLVPAPLAIDAFQGVAYVGLVAFAMPEVRLVRGLPPVPTAASFLETNVRTYVSGDGQPGVWFFSLDAASTLAVIGARVSFGLPYFRSGMRMDRDGDRVSYHARRLWPGPRPATLDLAYTAGEALGPAAPGTLEHFLVERYRLFARRGSGLATAEVRHAPYPLRRATVTALDETLIAAAGLTHGNERPPDLFSEGVDVDIFAPRPVPAR
jgi:uncharacterized protein YqjF (DUF2071 family)